MVLVFLKNLIFSPSPQNVTRTGTLCIDPAVVKYGSIGSSSAASPAHESRTASPTHSHYPNFARGRVEEDIEQGLGLGVSTTSQDNLQTEEEILDSVSDLSDEPAQLKKGCLSPRIISDAIIGLSDGLTVPFALTAGLSTFNDTRVVVYGGLAELIAGSISMGLGGWLAARGESEYYQSTVVHSRSLVSAYHIQIRPRSPSPDGATPTLNTSTSPIPQQVNDIFTPYSFPVALHSALITHLLSPEYPPEHLIALLIRHHHNLSPPEDHRAYVSAITIATGYFLGGFIPLLPYFFVAHDEVLRGLIWSVGVMGICLFFFGAWKTVAMDNEGRGEDTAGTSPLVHTSDCSRHKRLKKALRGGVEMVMVGGIAAGGAMGIVRFLGGIGE